MSRIGKTPVLIPDKVSVDFDGLTVTVKGPKGELKRQMPLARRLPRRGFTNIFKEKFQIVNVGDIINLEDGSVIDPVFLKDSGLIRSSLKPVKILGNGSIEKKIKITASAFSSAAKEKIEKAGGEIIIL